MSVIQFIIRNLKYYKKQHLAVFFGTLLSSAILTGALITGDSVKYTLINLVDKRLGNATFSLFTQNRFVRAELANDISKELSIKTTALLSLSGGAVNPENESQISSVQVLGIDNNFWELSDKTFSLLNDGEAIINSKVAEKLNLKVNSEFILRVQNAEIVPINSPFITKVHSLVTLRLVVKAIADDDNLGRFSLKNNQIAPFNIFVSREFLAKSVEMGNVASLILATQNNDNSLTESNLNDCLKKVWTLKDAGLNISVIDNQNYIELTSDRIFIDQNLSSKILQLNLPTDKIFTYFVNSLYTNNKETPYSFVTASTLSIQKQLPDSNKIFINSWLAEDLGAKIGDTLHLKYFVIGALRRLEEKSSQFIVQQIVSFNDSVVNKSLMPNFPGLSDVENCNEWNVEIPVDLKKIRDKDEEYWELYGGTPKALINIDIGEKLWKNQFGNYTAIRFIMPQMSVLELENKIIHQISPTDINLAFQDIRNQGNNAASNGVDFGGLFVSLSFFVIIAALLLIVLLYYQHIESRKTEKGILVALGFSRKKIIRLQFLEVLPPVVFGSIFGGFFGILYNYFIVIALRSIWQEAVNAEVLSIYIKTNTLIIGILSSTVVSLLTLFFVNRKKLKSNAISLISAQQNFLKPKNKIAFAVVSILSFLGAISLLITVLAINPNLKPTNFFVAATLFLIGILSLFLILITASAKKSFTAKNNHFFGASNLFAFALKNIGRNVKRSFTVVILLALGTFTIIVTGSNRQTFVGGENNRNSGTGGFLFWVETSIPIIYDLNSKEGKEKYGIENEEILNDVTFVQFFNLQGDDASCLNLHQVKKPQILGIEAVEFDKRSAFSFAKLLTPSENPWLELNKKYPDNLIPAFADMTVIQWGLIKNIGDTLSYTNEKGDTLKLLLIGGLNSSIFQGNILISDSIFRSHFPSVAGSQTLLVEASKEKEEQISELLQKQFSQHGISIEPVNERLTRFYSVTNTYLSVFMLLGGLGVILGTLGLGIVLIRNIHERESEIAFLQAVGFTKRHIFKSIFIENLLLLVVGIFTGLLSAVIAIIPSLLSVAYRIPSGFMFFLVALVFLSGLLWIYFPTQKAVNRNFIVVLRKD